MKYRFRLIEIDVAPKRVRAAMNRDVDAPFILAFVPIHAAMRAACSSVAVVEVARREPKICATIVEAIAVYVVNHQAGWSIEE